LRKRRIASYLTIDCSIQIILIKFVVRTTGDGVMGNSESNLARTVYLIIKSIFQKGVFSPRPENVSIERVGRKPIYPCKRPVGSEELNLDQLEWAAKEGCLWFSGPIESIKIIFDKGSVQGDLQLGTDRMLFTTSLTTLNYENFDAVAKRLREVAKELELELTFQSIGSYEVKLVFLSEKPLSVDNVNEFIDKLHILRQKSESGL